MPSSKLAFIMMEDTLQMFYFLWVLLYRLGELVIKSQGPLGIKELLGIISEWDLGMLKHAVGA